MTSATVFDADVGVVGAGIAGLSAAAQLAGAGKKVLVLEKSRGPGGRAATRHDGDDSFDHGAQYLSCRSPEFRALLGALESTGQVQRWDGRVSKVAADGSVRASPHERFVGVPGMNVIAQHLALKLDCRFNTTVAQLHYDAGWHAVANNDDTYSFRQLLLTAPPSQSAKLLAATSTPLLGELNGVVMQPCWALMLCFREPINVAFDAAYIDNAGPLSWCARDSSKPGRSSGERWVLHAAPGWSQRHLEAATAAVSAEMLSAFDSLTGSGNLVPTKQIAHRWRYAQAPSPLVKGCLYDASLHLALAGDWCAGSRVEGAYLSGLSAASRLLQQA